MKHQDALDLLARETARAGRRLAFERALRAGFWLLAAVGTWALIALMGLHERLPLLAQSLSALAALVLLGWLARRARAAWRPPTREEARARLAADSHLDCAAFEALEDRPTRYDVLSLALWRRECERALKHAEKACAAPPEPRLDELDPYRLRGVLIVALIVAAAFAGGAGPDRLARAFIPDPGPFLGDRDMAIEAWVTPAEYTRTAPVSLSERVGDTVATPPSIEATVRVTGPAGAPRLVFDGQGGRREVRFVRAADGAWEARLAISGKGRLSIVRFHRRATWRLRPQTDAAPTASFAAPIALAPEERAVIAWRAGDDYGVRHLLLRVTPVDPPRGLLRADPVDTPLETPAGDPREADGETAIDIGPHPYAGMEVEARLVAVDALGQEGVSEPLTVTLPEKVFLQPLARAAIEIRRHILTDRRPYERARPRRARTMPEGDILLGRQRIEVRDYARRPALERAPDGVQRAARMLDALTVAPQDGYFRDLAVYLGLRYARAQLAAARNIDDTAVAADTLWRTALRAEYGGAADARRALEEAHRQLADALAQGAPQERIRPLMEALRRATENYLLALVQEALRNGQSAENLDDTEEQTAISGRDIQELLRQVEELSEQGRNAEAQQTLDLLAGILANLEVRLAEASAESGDPSQDRQMQQSMDELSEAMGRQRELNDDTEQRQQQQNREAQTGGGQRQSGSGSAEDLAGRQSRIRQGLSEAQRMADESGAAPSPELDAAAQAMRRAEEALRRGDLEDAQAAQAAALESLREGAETLAAEMRERGRERGREGDGGGASGVRDPLGRTASGGNGEGENVVPNQSDPVRAREIFDEIRRRAQDANRPEAEREYLRRLLDRFGDS